MKISRTCRRLLLLVGVTSLWTLVPAVANAAQPERVYSPIPDFTITGVCPFPVDNHIVVNREYTMTFSDGRIIVTGALFWQVTNVDTGKTFTLNVSGPGFVGFRLGDGALVFNGRSLVGAPGVLVLTSGPVVITAADFTTTSAATIDMCAALADP